ncbi:MAG: recombinase family protein [Euryarchaeota archaeon]|nr:recombinase family protein [Euryarchaeota archaeon]MBU4031377.1 recombinase family protein [Candidatus Thermoplasmatota archaeon]MBU4072346.1 recombinase family protein [Candidatus Thermoplasmatota archaeon]MBU4145101.1 recombinase family protein [Candidatus Thermoplasmatota archaeon]
MQTRAAIYVRVSTLEQAENGWSIDGQISDIRNYCDSKDYKVVRIFKDAGFSGGDMKRPALQKMIEHGSNKAFEVVILWKYDRLSRNNIDFPALLHYLKTHDIVVESVNEPTPNDGSPYNEFVVGILGLVSSLERRVITMRTQMGIKKRLEAGYYKGSHPPYGYDYNQDTGHLDPHPIESKAVVVAFQKYLEYESLNQVRNFLEKMEYPTKKGGNWGITSIRSILRNRVYLGYYIYDGIIRMNEDIKLIDEETFEKVQHLMDERGKYSPMYKHNGKAALRAKEADFMDMGDEEVEAYLQQKADMPPCPRCDGQITVCKWGFRDSPTVGRLQQYYCRDCNYEFEQFPELPPREDVEPCPHCDSVYKVRKEGTAKNTAGERYQKYYCGGCERWFR